MTEAQEAVFQPQPEPPAAERGIEACGTLRYTKWGMLNLFVWLLWGDLVWTLMESLIPRILPLKLSQLNCPSWLIPYFITTSQALTVFIICPVISFKSDRHRSRVGRRIPYLLWSTPFLSAFLVLFGFSEAIGHSLYAPASHLLGFPINETTSILVMLAVFLLGYRIFDAIAPQTVYYYLFNDVVPQDKLATFNAWFRIVGVLTGMAYAKFIFPHAMEYFPQTFAGVGLLYLFGFMVMCFKVKEGQYSPPPANVDKKAGLISSLRTYCKECFTHRFYWYFFLMSTSMAVSYLMGASFGVLRDNESLKLDMDRLGDLQFYQLLATLIMLPFLGWIADKVNPIRAFVAMGFVLFISPILQCVFIFKDFGPAGNFWFVLMLGLVILPFDTLMDTVTGPMYMRLLPKARYGQFASANGTIRALARILMSMVVGPVMMLMIKLSPSKEFAYRLYPLWQVVFQVPTLICLLLLYREWKRLGGAKSYVPPEV